MINDIYVGLPLPMEKKCVTHFNNTWKEKEDYGLWLSKSLSNTGAKWTLCDSYFSIGSSGISHVEQHSRSAKHASRVTTAAGQITLQLIDAGMVTNESGSRVKFNYDDQVIRAEVVLLFRLIKYDHSFSSNDGLTETLKYIFPDNNIVRNVVGINKIILLHCL